MKFRVTMKDPDGVQDSIDDAITESIKWMPGLSAHESNALYEARREEIGKQTGKWFEYGEYLTVEVDTEAGTCVVVPV